jgi:T5SS/PEP-CTERM-associated repeat protein
VIYPAARTALLRATLFTLGLYASIAHGVVYNWDGSSGSQFSNGANWTPAGVPGTNDTATFRLGAVAVPILLLDAMFQLYNATVDRLIVGTNTVTMGGGTMTVDGTDITETARGLIIGQTATDVAVLNMNLPSLSTLYGTLGSAAGSSGTLNLTSTVGAFNVTGSGAIYDLIVGLNGTGAINVASGRDVTVADDTALGLNATGVGNVSVSGAGSIWTSSGDLRVGELGGGALTISAAALVSDSTGYIGASAGSNGTASITGAGSSWTNSIGLIVGYFGNGTLDITSGGQATSGTSGYVGYFADAIGSATVSGASSAWSNSLSTIVGTLGTGSLTVSAGGLVSDSFGVLGSGAGSDGTATITGANSRWNNTSNLFVGDSGNGTLAINSGGLVSNVNGYVGDDAGAIGDATVSGTDSTWTNTGDLYVGNAGSGTMTVSNAGEAGTNGNLYVGNLGSGTLNITAGGNVTNAVGYIGNQAGSTGQVTVDGANSKWTNSGNFFVGNLGDGTLTIENSGQVEVSDSMSINNLSTVNLQSGTLRVGSLSGGTNLNWTGGTLHLTASNFIADTGGTLGSSPTIGPTQTLMATVTSGIHSVGESGAGLMTVNGGLADFGISLLTVGRLNGSDGTLNVTNGGFASTTQAIIGSQTGSTGVVNIDGVDLINSRRSGFVTPSSNQFFPFIVGDEGNGTLSVTGGALVQVASPTNAEVSAVIGASDGSFGQMRIDGVSFLGPSTFAFVGQGVLRVGWLGDGTLEITDGGQVFSTRGIIAIAASGEVTVDGDDSAWNNSGELVVGAGGNASLTISGRGYVNNAAGTIGQTGTGMVIVEGIGSQWFNSAGLFVGGSGTGTLQIAGGGNVTSDVGYIGFQGGSGAVVVDGIGSTWNCGTLLVVGANSSGTLTVSNGGTVNTNIVSVGLMGEVRGDGNIQANVTNFGLVSPGTSVGSLHVVGDFDQFSSGEILTEIASDSSFDRLLVTFNAMLAGTLTVNLIDGFMPSIGQMFTILTADNVIGEFDTEPFPTASNFGFDVIYNAQSVVLLVVSALSGDYNGNGTVDAADYTLWRDNLGSGTSLANDDTAGVGQDDYDRWKTNFGQTAGVGATSRAAHSPPRLGGSTAAVPEPAALAILAIALALLAPTARRNRAASWQEKS